MQKTRPALFRRRHFQDHVIVLCVRWYLRYCLTLRDLEELMAERGLSVDHSTIGRWVLDMRRNCPSGIVNLRGCGIFVTGMMAFEGVPQATVTAPQTAKDRDRKSR